MLQIRSAFLNMVSCSCIKLQQFKPEDWQLCWMGIMEVINQHKQTVLAWWRLHIIVPSLSLSFSWNKASSRLLNPFCFFPPKGKINTKKRGY